MIHAKLAHQSIESYEDDEGSNGVWESMEDEGEDASMSSPEEVAKDDDGDDGARVVPSDDEDVGMKDGDGSASRWRRVHILIDGYEVYSNEDAMEVRGKMPLGEASWGPSFN